MQLPEISFHLFRPAPNTYKLLLFLFCLPGLCTAKENSFSPAIINDTAAFRQFADSCLRNKADDYLIETFRGLVDGEQVELEAAHLGFLNRLYGRMDRSRPTLNSYYVCYYLGRTITAYHLDENMPLRYFNEAASIAEQLNEQCLAAKAYLSLATFNMNIRHDLLRANEYIAFTRQYLEQAKLDGISDCDIDVNARSATLNYYLQDYHKSVAELNQSIAAVGKLKRPRQLYDLYKRRAFFEIELDRYRDALRTMDTALSIVKDLPGSERFVNHILSLKFNAFIGLSDFREAVRYVPLIKAEELRDDNDDYFDYMNNLIKLHIRFGQYETAKRHMDVYEALLKPWNIQRWRKLYEVKYLLFKTQGDYREALDAYERFKYYDDSVHRQRQNYTILQQQIKYETNQKEKSLQAQMAVNRMYAWIIILGSVMAAAIIALIYSNYRRSRKNVVKLQALNGQINDQKLELEAANRDKDRILHIVAHDLRSPVGGIFYLSELVMDEDLPGGAQQKLNLIKKASANSLLLINELLGLNAGKLQHEDTVDLNDLVNEAVQILNYKAEEKRQQVVVQLADEPVFATLNRERIIRLLSNLLINAIKFSFPESHITVRTGKDSGGAFFSVQDEGVGIPPNQLEQVFEIFTSAKRKGTAGEQSFGLGLSICRQIAEEHEGVIRVESVEGKGTIFTVRLPLG